MTFAPTCFGSRRNHHQGAVLCLAKSTNVVFIVFVVIDVVSVMAAYHPVAQACRIPALCVQRQSIGRESLLLPSPPEWPPRKPDLSLRDHVLWGFTRMKAVQQQEREIKELLEAGTE